MMGAARQVVLTGCAGFIGSHLAEHLLGEGFWVRGIDCFTPYYDRADKEHNLQALRGDRHFELVEADLSSADLPPLFAGAELVFHLAAQAGVRGSFGDSFAGYARDNLLASQRVFEAARGAGARRVVWASSSSVYGDAEAYPCVEDQTPTRPRSPYGVTKRACEDLAGVYRQLGLDTAGLRYFTVYGPRQRPDMALRRICDALVGAGSFQLNGDGTQSRDFTYVADACEATLRAGLVEAAEPVYNIGGGEEASMLRIIQILEDLAGTRLPLRRVPAQAGDVKRTAADVTRARRSLGWEPAVRLADGLARMLDWCETRHEAGAVAA
jgi:UDP-glucuronate 4-epimerase